MFNEDADWSDEAEAQTLSKAVHKSAEKTKNNKNAKPKVVGKKSLLRTLQTLGSVPEWKADERQHDSDSDSEAAPAHSKRKKKRRRRTKASEKPEAQEENGDIEASIKEDKTTTQKRKKNPKIGPPRAKTTSVSETTGEQTTQSENKPEDADKLSRQQWRNKMKNRRKCNNKYRPNKPDEEVNKAEPARKQTPKEEITADSSSHNKKTQNKKTEKERRPQKRKNPEEQTDSCGTSQTIKARKIQNAQSDGSFLDGSERKVGVANQQEQTPANKQKPEMSRKQILKREQLRRLLQGPRAEQKRETAASKEEEAEVEARPEEAAAAPAEVKLDRSASLRSRMEQRLDSARFRYINEVLYSSTSGEATRMFRQDPQAFWVYHRGYTAQVLKWPVNPVDGIIAYIRQKSASLVVADFGCGDCKIARNVKNKVHNFDLAATCDLVTVCDMANVPLKDRSVDIAVFCLSLMGTNLADFLAEANRVLKISGVLKIAEVASRFDNVRNFLNALAKLGFKMTSKDTENTHFYSFDFVKTNDAPENRKKFGLQLKACLYKKR